MNKLQKMIATWVLAVMMMVTVPTAGAVLSGLYSFATGTDILAGEMNYNLNKVIAAVNNVDGTQLAANSVTTSKIVDGTILSADMNCAVGSYWDLITACGGVDNADAMHTHSMGGFSGTISAAQHGDLSGATSTMHTAESVVIVDSGGYYTSTDVEGALQEAGAAVATSSISFQGYDYHATTAASCAVTVPANTASNGFIVTWGAFVNDSGGAGYYLPIHIQSTGGGYSLDLSTAGSQDARFHIRGLSALNTELGDRTKFVAVNSTTTSGKGFTLDLTKDNTFSIGTEWGVGSAAGSNFIISVVAY